MVKVQKYIRSWNLIELCQAVESKAVPIIHGLLSEYRKVASEYARISVKAYSIEFPYVGYRAIILLPTPDEKVDEAQQHDPSPYNN